MIAFAPKSLCSTETTPDWRVAFLRMLPLIYRCARHAFRDLAGDDFDDAVQEVIANTLVAYERLARQGRADAASATPLARFAVAQYWEGRRVGARLNVQDITSDYCQRRKRVKVESLDHWDTNDQEWKESLVEDKTITPADLAASRLDVPAWLGSLSTRSRKIAEALAMGESTGYVARTFGISAARVSQLRRELQDSWSDFHEPTGASPRPVAA